MMFVISANLPNKECPEVSYDATTICLEDAVNGYTRKYSGEQEFTSITIVIVNPAKSAGGYL